MPFGEVMYRCNAHYCFSSVFRNRVVGLVITLALMQLFLFSFYLNGLHSQAAVTLGGNPNAISPSSSSEQLDPQQLPATFETEEIASNEVQRSHGGRAPVADHERHREQENGNRLPQKVNPNGSKFAAKKAIDQLVSNNKPTLDLVLMAAKKLTASDSSSDPMVKFGLDVLANNLINSRKNVQPQPEQKNDGIKPNKDNRDNKWEENEEEEEEKSKRQYANLAQIGLQLLSNGVDASSSSANGKTNGDPSMLEMATQFMIQNAKSKAVSGLIEPQLAKTALGLLKGAMGNQKLDPKLLLSLDPQLAKAGLGLLKNTVENQKLDSKTMLSLLSKVVQPQQSGQRGNDGSSGLGVFSQLLSNGQLVSDLTKAIGGLQQREDSSVDPSPAIYRNYVQIATKKLPALRPNSNRRIVVNLDFKFPIHEPDGCTSNTTHLVVVISSSSRLEERQAARDTWVREFRQLSNENDQVRVLFFVGKTNNATLQRSVESEAASYHDLVQTNVEETMDKTYKTLAALAWVNQECAGVRQVLKTEDDVYVSAAKMMKVMESSPFGPFIAGSLVASLNPHDASDEAHRIPKALWPLKQFPRFLLGGSYLISRPGIPRLLEAAQVTPVLPLEDVYITGLCAAGGNVELIPNKSIFEEEISEELVVCTFEDYGSWRSTGPADVLQTWNFAQTMKRSGEICVKSPANKCARFIMGICVPS